MGEWLETTLGEILTLNYGKALPEKIRVPGNIPVFSSAGQTGTHNEPLVCGSGLIVGRKGTIGSVYKSEKPFFVIDTAYYILPDENSYDLYFLYYFLSNLHLNDLNEDSAVPGLNRNTVYSLQVKFPEPDIQKAIAEVLSSLDDKIDLLHRQNKTLEGLAETLFRQMFIENAKDEWDDGTLRDLVELHYGKGLKRSIRTGSGFPVVGSSGVVDYHDEYFVKGPGIVIGRKGTLGKVIYLTDNFFPIDTTYYVKPAPGYGFIFTYYLLKIQDYKEMNTDSAVPGLNRDIALSVELKVPSPEMAEEFENICIPVFDKRSKNIEQIKSLENLRDTLLPKLMSGEVRVKYEES